MEKLSPALTEHALMERVNAIAGFTMQEIADRCGIALPKNLVREKGFQGQLLEMILGTTAGNQSLPDFQELNIELKTLPLTASHQPKESTFVCTTPQRTEACFEDSVVWKKLQRVLWIPIEANPTIPLAQRRIGQGILWSPTPEQARILKEDWTELTELLSLGRYSELTARRGQYLQLRPKAAHTKVLRASINEQGEEEFIVPRGFYLRTRFTQQILEKVKYI